MSTPNDSAPTPPIRDAGDVMNYYSDAYTEISGTTFNPFLGQTTQVSTIVVDGNNILKFSNLNYHAFLLASAQNVSTMNYLHLDIWTPDCTSLEVHLNTNGTVTLTPTLSSWNSFDILLTSFSEVELSSITMFNFSSPLNSYTTVYLDNIYFYKSLTTTTTTTEAPTHQTILSLESVGTSMNETTGKTNYVWQLKASTTNLEN